MSEPTINRRLRAFYERAGMSRSDFAKAMDLDYSIVNNWDKGKHLISLPQLATASKLLGVSADDIIFGHEGRPVPTDPTAPLRDERVIVATLDAIDASPEARAAFGAHLTSAVAKYQRINADYVRRYVEVFTLSRADGMTAALADERGYHEAINQRALKASAASQQSSTPKRKPQRPKRTLPLSSAGRG